MARPAGSYRAARRNKVLRDEKRVWGGPVVYLNPKALKRGLPLYRKHPGKYPLHMRPYQAEFQFVRKNWKEAYRAMLQATGQGHLLQQQAFG